MRLTQCSIVQIIYRDLGPKCLSFTNTLAVAGYLLLLVFYIYISQRNVETSLRCGPIFTNHFIANFPASVRVKKKMKIG